MSDLLTAFRDHLIEADLVRDPLEAGDLPPLFLELRGGAPGPGDLKPPENHPDLVITAYLSGGISPAPHQSMLRKDTVDVWLRSRQGGFSVDFEEAMREEIVDKRAWLMGELEIIESLEWRALARVPEEDGQPYTYIVSYIFERRSP